jgi:hypothetical protein
MCRSVISLPLISPHHTTFIAIRKQVVIIWPASEKNAIAITYITDAPFLDHPLFSNHLVPETVQLKVQSTPTHKRTYNWSFSSESHFSHKNLVPRKVRIEVLHDMRFIK